MNVNKYRVELITGNIQISVPCQNEIEVLKQISLSDCDSFMILEYQKSIINKSGITEYPLKRISRKQFIESVIAVTMKGMK
jgi:hypothetical protein